MPKKRETLSTSVRKEAENYRSTVHALHIFADFLKRGDKSARYSIGRRMTTSENNLVSKKTDQTPDLVVQVSPREGYICEAKASMANKKDWWDDHAKQLQRYDDDLEGWWTDSKKLENDSNTILLVSSEKSIKFKKHVEEAIQSGAVSFRKPIAFVGFMQTSTPDESMLFQLDWGTVYNDSLHNALEDRKLIPLELFIASVGHLKFYDSPPPVEYMMEILWTHLFNELKSNIQFDQKTRTWPFDINIQDITNRLQKLYGQHSAGEREASFPQIKWLREALEHFEALGLAKRKNLDHYTILYKQLRGDLLERFSRARNKMKEKNERKRQQVLFPTEINDSEKAVSTVDVTTSAEVMDQTTKEGRRTQ